MSITFVARFSWVPENKRWHAERGDSKAAMITPYTRNARDWLWNTLAPYAAEEYTLVMRGLNLYVHLSHLWIQQPLERGTVLLDRASKKDLCFGVERFMHMLSTKDYS